MLELTGGPEPTSRYPLRSAGEHFVAAALQVGRRRCASGSACALRAAVAPNDEIGAAVEAAAQLLGARRTHVSASFSFRTRRTSVSSAAHHMDGGDRRGDRFLPRARRTGAPSRRIGGAHLGLRRRSGQALLPPSTTCARGARSRRRRATWPARSATSMCCCCRRPPTCRRARGRSTAEPRRSISSAGIEIVRLCAIHGDFQCGRPAGHLSAARHVARRTAHRRAARGAARGGCAAACARGLVRARAAVGGPLGGASAALRVVLSVRLSRPPALPPSASFAARAQDRFGVAVGLLAALEHQIAGGLERDVVVGIVRRACDTRGRRRSAGRRPPPCGAAPASPASCEQMPWRSQLATCWLEMRSVARSSISATL